MTSNQRQTASLDATSRLTSLRRALAVTLILAATLVPASRLSAQPSRLPLSEYSSIESCLDALREPGRASSDTQPRRDILRVLSWNTMKFARDGAMAFLMRISTSTDLLLLQESLAEYADAGPSLPWRMFSPGYRTRDMQSGVELRSALTPDLSCHLQFMEPWLRTPKAMGVARLRLGEERLLIVNVHAINFTLGSSAYRAQLSRIGELLEAHEGPAIVAGDMNNWNQQRQRALEQFAGQYSLSIAKFVPDWRSRHLGKPVDGFLMRGMRIIDATALPTKVSDHHPIAVSLGPVTQDSRRRKDFGVSSR